DRWSTAASPTRRLDHPTATAAGARASRTRGGDRWHVRWRDGAPLPGSGRMRARARSLLFHGALQRMLVLAREVHHLCNLGLCDFIGIDAANADALLVHMHHDACGLLTPLVEETLQHVHDELHRRVVVV